MTPAPTSRHLFWGPGLQGPSHGHQPWDPEKLVAAPQVEHLQQHPGLCSLQPFIATLA